MKKLNLEADEVRKMNELRCLLFRHPNEQYNKKQVNVRLLWARHLPRVQLQLEHV